MLMKKNVILLLTALLMSAAAQATVARRPMLEQGKTWWYTYHRIEFKEPEVSGDDDEVCFPVAYTLRGDTVIGGRQYMKLYSNSYEGYAPHTPQYYGAYREDEQGRVYMCLPQSTTEYLRIDFTLAGEGSWTPVAETIKANGQLFCRYRYDYTYEGTTQRDKWLMAVEGVGFRNGGLVIHPLDPVVDCICDYQTFDYVEGSGWMFTNADFTLPKEIELSGEERQLVANNNDFAFRLFREARGAEDLILSPLSITYALGMLNNGAAGQTQQEINTVLGFSQAGADGINQFCHKMMTECATLDDATKALLANNIYLNQDYVLKPGFVQKANDYYDAQPETRNFSDGLTRGVINQWASDHTEGMIDEVLKESEFNEYAVSYLLNALYFKGAWATKFDPGNTREESFNGGLAVPMMHLVGSDMGGGAAFRYSENELYQTVRLPYGNGAYVMTVFLPREGKTIGDVLERLDGSNWQSDQVHQCMVDLKLPRFETNTNVDLKSIMSELGMPSAFIWQVAEFPDFCNVPTYIGLMKQVSKIKLDEQGTEAAAVTIIGEATSGVPDFAEFHATRPFLYVISEQSTGAIFFMGQYMGPVTTAISERQMGGKSGVEAIYTLSGQRLSAAPTRGLYIREGRKMVRSR